MRFLLFLNFLFSVCFLSACMSRRCAEVIEALELAGGTARNWNVYLTIMQRVRRIV